MVQLLQCKFCDDEYPETQIEKHLVGEHGVDGPKENVVGAVDDDDDDSKDMFSPDPKQNIMVCLMPKSSIVTVCLIISRNWLHFLIVLFIYLNIYFFSGSNWRR